MHTPTILPATCGACFSEVSILFLRLFGSMKMSLCVSNREQVSSSQPPQTRKLCQVHALVAQCPLSDDDWIRARMWKNNRSPPHKRPNRKECGKARDTRVANKKTKTHTTAQHTRKATTNKNTGCKRGKKATLQKPNTPARQQ